MIISIATPADLPELLELEAQGFQPGQRWSAASWASELDAADRLVLVSREAGLLAAASFSVLADTAELLRVVVRPDQTGRGLGRRLVQLGQQWAADLGAERMLLEVRHDNEPALALYRRTGFTAIARRADYYGPGFDAVVMEHLLERGWATADDEMVEWAS